MFSCIAHGNRWSRLVYFGIVCSAIAGLTYRRPLQAVPLYSMRDFHCCYCTGTFFWGMTPCILVHIYPFLLVLPKTCHLPVSTLPFRPPGRRRLQDFPKVRKFYQTTRRRVSVDSSVFAVLHWPVFDPYNYIRTEEHAPTPSPFHFKMTLRFGICHILLNISGYLIAWLRGCTSVTCCLSEKKGFVCFEFRCTE